MAGILSRSSGPHGSILKAEKVVQIVYRSQWILLVAAAPFLIFPSPRRSLALLVIPLLLLISWLARREPIPATPLNGSLLLMALMVLVSSWATYDLRVSLSKITGVLLGFAVFWSFARFGHNTNGWRWCLVCLLATSLAMVGISLVGTVWVQSKFSLLARIAVLFPVRLTGLAGAESGINPNQVAGSLLWVLPLSISLAAGKLQRAASQPSGRAWLQVAAAGALTLFLLGVFLLAQSRSAFLGLALTLFFMLGLAMPRKGRAVLVVLLLMAVVGMAILIQQGRLDFFSAIGLRTASAENDATQLGTLENRLELWRRAIDAIQDFPLTGMGMNVFRQAVHSLYPLFLISPDVDVSHAHNEFLQAALDLGIPGLLAFIALHVSAFAMLAQLARQDPSRLTREEATGTQLTWLLLGLGGGLVAHLLFGLTDAVALGAKTGILFWMLLGLIAGLHSRYLGEVRSRPAPLHDPDSGTQ